MYNKQTVFCPVCTVSLGYLTKDEVCSFVCNECKWIFTWDRKGKLGPPLQVNKKKRNFCGCAGCQAREEQASKDAAKNRYL